LILCSAGINIAINKAMMAITTKNSINVKPYGLRMLLNLTTPVLVIRLASLL